MFRAIAPKPLVSKAKSMPAPTGGLNDLDPISNMDPSFLLDSMNFFPDTGLLVVRPGYQEWATNLGKAVDTIMAYNAMDGSFQRFAATADGIFDITAPTSAPVNVKPATNGYWEHVNFATAGTQNLIAANGVDPAVLYNGTTWVSFTEVPAPAAPGEISGVDPSTFSHVISHKGRLWFIQKNTMTAWYLPVDSLGGVAQPFFLGGIFRRGGYLAAIARWSADTGEGLDDRLVFFTSSGEVASYAGNDPSQADDWSLDSVFFVAPPLSKRAVTDYGGDLLMLTRRGLIPISSLISGRANEILYSSALTRRISRTLIKLTGAPNPPFPAMVVLYNDAAWVVINIFNAVPSQVPSESNRPVQLVMNFLTGAWGTFDYPVQTVRTIDKLFFMGTANGRVLTVTPDQHLDNVQMNGTSGVPITASMTGAYSYLDNPNSNKHAKFVRPVFQSEVKPSFVLRVLPDFRLDPFLLAPTPAVAIGNAKWDISNWDLANWGGFENVYRPWVSANVLGYAFAVQIKVSTASPLGLAALEWIWEDGGYI